MYDKIRELCKKNGISVAALESKLCFGNGTIYKWKVCSPTADKLKKAADALGVTVDELLKEE